MSFAKDDKIKQIAEAYTLDAIDIARDNFGVTLDRTEASIAVLESLLQTLHEQLPSAKPSQETIWTFAKAFGSYVGEVYRAHHGAEWGLVDMNGQQFPGLQAATGACFWPWGRVHNRLVEGPENNVLHYYQHLTKKQ